MGRDHVAVYSEVARLFEPDNAKHFSALLETASGVLRGMQTNAEMVSFYASISCGLAVGIRLHTGVNLCTVSFPLETLPIHSTHPISKALPILDHIIKSHLDWVASADSEDSAFADNVAKLHAALIWKAYLFALNTEPSAWGADALHAMNSLRIISTADATEVIETNKREAKDDGIRKAIQPDDWPPSGYIKLYFANRQLIVYKNKMLFGIDSPVTFR